MMEWIVEKDELLAVLDVLDLVPMRPGQPSSEFFEVTPSKKGGLWFRLAADINGVSHLRGSGQWPFKKAFYLDRKVFVPFVVAAKNLKSQPFVFKKVGTRLLVKQGRRKASFDSRPEVPGYAPTPKGKEHSEFKLQNTLRELIYCARECASDDTQPQLHCVYIRPEEKSVSVLASNQKIIYRAVIHNEQLKNRTSIPFPVSLVSSLTDSDQLKEIKWIDEYVILRFTHGKIWQPVNAIAAKDFPHREIIHHMGAALEVPVLFECPIPKFTEPVNRLCEYLGAVRREWTLEIQGVKGSDVLQLTVAVPQTTFREQVKLPKALKNSFEVAWPLEMLQPVFNYLQKKGKGELIVRRKEKGVSYVSAPNITVAVPRKHS